MSAALTLLAQIAPDFAGLCAQPDTGVGRLSLPIQLVDGRTISYSLELRDFDGVVSVREAVPERLPAFCPERHINSDGTFCLSYSPVQPLKVEDENSARAWLETLYKFLKLQERVKSQRKWPNDHGWAHGGAAKHQLQARIAANKLGHKIRDALSSRQLSVRRRFSKGRPLLELIYNGECLYRVWEAERKVANGRRRCFCGSSGQRRSKAIRKCADHGKQAVEFVFELYDWDREERRYWDTMRGMKCCGTCDGCELADGQAGLANDGKSK